MCCLQSAEALARGMKVFITVCVGTDAHRDTGWCGRDFKVRRRARALTLPTDLTCGAAKSFRQRLLQ